MAKLDYGEIEAIADTSPTVYPVTPTLNAIETAILISALSQFDFRPFWIDAGGEISDQRWDELQEVIGQIMDKLLE